MKTITRLVAFLLVPALVLPVFGEESDQSVVTLKIDRMLKGMLKNLPPQETPVPVAVMDFGVSAGKAKARQLGKAVAVMAHKSLTEDSRFTLVEREKLEKIANEIALGQSGLVDEGQAKKAGDMLGAHLIITGNVSEIGEYFLINARVVDVGTAQVRANAAVEIKQGNLVAVSSKYVVVRKYSIVPAFQSLIIPGWGQLYNDQPRKAAFFVVMAAASGGTFGFSYLMYQNVKYDEAESSSAATKEFKKWQRFYKTNQASMYACAAVWGLAFIDAFWVSHRNLKKGKAERSASVVSGPLLYAGSGGVGVKVNVLLPGPDH